MNENKLIITIFLLQICIGLFLLFSMAGYNIETLEKRLTEINCCEGSFCTDTYYTPENNLCHLVLCENNFGGESCTYEGRNISLGDIK